MPRENCPSSASSVQSPASSVQNIQNNYHSGKCTICNHPDRAEIEAAFLNWEPADRIVADFKLPARSSLYRHANAADLLNQRRNNLRAALDHIIEQAATARATASDVLNAIELSYRLSGTNVAPLRRYEVTYKHIHETTSAVRPNSASSFQPPVSSLQKQPSLRKQSGHSHIVAAPNSLNPKEGHDKQSGHT
jgi:hypothetical protein